MNNVEKLRNYFLGKDPQLKETMADNSLRLIGIEGKHFVLRTELLKRLIDLKKQVDDKDEELQANIDAVIEDLSGEQEARIADDETLQGNIDAEASTRLGADLALDGRVDTLETDTSTLLASVPYTALTQDIRIYQDNPVIAGLSDTGWYYTGEHVVYFEDSVEPAWNENTIFYYSDDGEEKYLTFFPDTMANGYEILKAIMWWNLDFHQWIFDGWWVTYSISPDSTDNQIPTAAAVAQTLTENFQAKFATVLGDNVALADGAATTLPVGLYYTDTHYVSVNNNPEIGRGSFFYVENSNQLYSLDMKLLTVSKSVSYNTGSHEWSVTNRQFLLTSQISTTIDDTSSNTEVASAKAVYDFAGEHYSTTERVVGTWIDGKPLYEKTITGTVPTTSSNGTYVTVDIYHNISNPDIMFETSKFIKSPTSSTGEAVSLPYFTNGNYQVKCNMSDTKSQIVNGVTYYNGWTAYITLRYTKTTD